MVAIAHAGCLIGIDAHPVQVEVQVGTGLPGFDIVGLPERGVRESRVRVKSALTAVGFKRTLFPYTTLFRSRKSVV